MTFHKELYENTWLALSLFIHQKFLDKIDKANAIFVSYEFKTQVEIYNWLGTAPVPPGGCRYWHCTGIIPGGKRLGTGIRPKCHSAGSCLSVLAWY